MEPDIKELQTKLLETVEQGLTPLRERIEAESKKFGEETAETKQAWDKVNTRLDDIEVKWQRALDEASRRVAPGNGPSSDEFKGLVEWCRKGENVGPDEQKVLIVADDTAGGYLVPEDYRAEILKGVVEFSPIRDIARKITTSRQSVKFPKRTGTFTAQWVAETATRTETTGLAYGMDEIPTHEMYALADVSNQLLEDAAFDIAAELSAEFGEQFGKAEGTAFVSGDAVGKPEGFLTASISSVTSATNDVLAADDIIELYFTPKTEYARRGTFCMNRGILKAVRKMKDTTNQYLWQPGLAGLAPATILDRPYLEVPDMAAAVADAAVVMVFGDFNRAYMIVDRVQLSIQRDPYTQATAGATRFIARKRVGGQVVVTEALKKLVIQ